MTDFEFGDSWPIVLLNWRNDDGAGFEARPVAAEIGCLAEIDCWVDGFGPWQKLGVLLLNLLEETKLINNFKNKLVKGQEWDCC